MLDFILYFTLLYFILLYFTLFYFILLCFALLYFTLLYFMLGVAYNIDPMLGNCTITTIDAFGFDVKSKDRSHVRMRTQKEFFYFDKVGYEYAGKV